MSLDSYKTLYYDKPLQDYQISMLSKPNNFNLTEFYCTALVDATKRFYTAENEEINTMKRESAKVKRRANVVAIIQLVKNELQNKCSSTSAFPSALNEIEKLETSNNTSL